MSKTSCNPVEDIIENEMIESYSDEIQVSLNIRELLISNYKILIIPPRNLI